MAYTQADLTRLREARASGVLKTRHEDRWIEYRTLADMDRVIAEIEAALGVTAGTPIRRVARVYQDGKGL